MAYYDALIAKWGTLSGTTAAKLAAINALTVTGPAQKAILSPSSILNAVVFADLAGLTQLQVTQLTLLLQGSSVDASAGTSIRLGIQTLFSGKTQTLANLGALVAPFVRGIILPPGHFKFLFYNQLGVTMAGSAANIAKYRTYNRQVS